MTFTFQPGRIYRNRKMLDVDFYLTSIAQTERGFYMEGFWVSRDSGELMGTRPEIFLIPIPSDWELLQVSKPKRHLELIKK